MNGEGKSSFWPALLCLGILAGLGIAFGNLKRKPNAQPAPVVRQELPLPMTVSSAPKMDSAPAKPVTPVVKTIVQATPTARAIPELTLPKSTHPWAKAIARAQKGRQVAIDVIRDFLAEDLKEAMTFQVLRYSDPPEPVKFQGRKAEVVRVIYQVQAGSGRETSADQLFLVQSQEVKQQVNFNDWVAHVRHVQEELARQQQLAMQQAIQEEMMAQQMAMAQPSAMGFSGGGQPMLAHRLQGPCRS